VNGNLHQTSTDLSISCGQHLLSLQVDKPPCRDSMNSKISKWLNNKGISVNLN